MNSPLLLWAAGADNCHLRHQDSKVRLLRHSSSEAISDAIILSLTTTERVCEGAKAAESGKRVNKKALQNFMVLELWKWSDKVKLMFAEEDVW